MNEYIEHIINKYCWKITTQDKNDLFAETHIKCCDLQIIDRDAHLIVYNGFNGRLAIHSWKVDNTIDLSQITNINQLI